jgi:hypothetical protein
MHSTLETDRPAYSFRVSIVAVPGQGRVLYRSVLLRHGRPMVVGSEMRVNILHKVNRKSLAL